MRILETDAATNRATVMQSGIAKLTRHLGSDRFESLLTEFVESKLCCRHMTAFAFGQKRAPKILGLMSNFRVEAVRRAADHYVQSYWQSDPTNIFHRGRLGGRSCALLMTDDDVVDRDFRRDCYTQTGIAQRLSVIAETDRHVIKISFHRPQTAGVFQDDLIDDMIDSGQLLASLLLRHHEITTNRRDDEDPERFAEVLAQKYPQLSDRERQVCSMIAIGISSEGIALTLGISINTVLTFRRRAYARLNISTQNELMRLLLRELID
ncbi:MAG: hypothetical protein IAE87_13710 [Rhodobacteraceae bacterium]|nr:hypothetical protein [Paracoccaceae bacterium]